MSCSCMFIQIRQVSGRVQLLWLARMHSTYAQLYVQVMCPLLVCTHQPAGVQQAVIVVWLNSHFLAKQLHSAVDWHMHDCKA